MKVWMEVKAGEGGRDSRLFLQDLKRMYTRYCAVQGWDLECL